MNANDIRIAQDAGKTLLIVDMDRSLDIMALANAGVLTSLLLVTQPDDEGQALDVITSVLKSGCVEIVVVFGKVSPLLMTQIRNVRWNNARRNADDSIELCEVFQA
jgi:RecA/RadA recombinase